MTRVARLATVALLGCVSISISGCVVTPTAQQIASADYGAEPAAYESTVRAYFESILKDPGSVQYREITAPYRSYLTKQRGLVFGGPYNEYGWIVKVTCNAKNSYGGYVGFKTYILLFRGEQIVDSIDEKGL